MKRILLILMTFLVITPAVLSQKLITYTFEDETIGDVITVPVEIDENFPADLNYIEVILLFDATVLSYNAVLNIQGGSNVINVSNVTGGKKFLFRNIDPFATFNVVAGKIFDINFIYQGGDSPLTFGAASRFRASFGTPVFIVQFEHGEVIGGFVDNIIVDGDWEDPADWSLPVIPNAYHNVFVQGNALISSNAVCNNLTIEVGGKLTVGAVNSLVVGGDVLIDSDPSGTGSFVNLGAPLSINGTVKQFMTGALAWHLVSVPVDEVWSADVFLNCYLQTWNEPTSGWLDVQPDPDPSFSVPMNTPMLGYATAFHGSADKMLEFVGELNDGPYSIAVTNVGPAGAYFTSGWNLIGNPYPSAIDADQLVYTNVDNGVAYWDQTLNGGVGDYAYYNIIGVGGTNEIPAMQGFFVKANGAGSVAVGNAARIHSNVGFYKSDPANTLRLVVQTNELRSEAVVRFVEGAGINYDGQYDFMKLFVDDVPQLYSITSNNEFLAINALPEIDEDTPVNVGLKPGVNATMSLTANGVETFESSLPIWLYDHVAGVHWNLRENPVYNFVANTGDDENRFSIHFKNLTGVPGIDQQSVSIYVYNKQIFVDAGAGNKGEIVVLNVLGQEVYRTTLNENLNVISVPVSNSNVVVKVISDQGISSRKVFVN